MRPVAVGLLVAVVAAGCSDDAEDGSERGADGEVAEDHDHDSHDHSDEDGDGEVAIEDLPSEVSAETEDGRSIEVSLASECVVPGEEQTVRVEAWPGAHMLYQAIYSGDVDGLDPDHPGGNDRGEPGDDGAIEGSWVVAEGGPVHFGVIVIGDASGSRPASMSLGPTAPPTETLPGASRPGAPSTRRSLQTLVPPWCPVSRPTR